MNKITEVRLCIAGMFVGQRGDNADQKQGEWWEVTESRCHNQRCDVAPKGQMLALGGTTKILFFLCVKHRY